MEVNKITEIESRTPFQHATRYWIIPVLTTILSVIFGIYFSLNLKQTYHIQSAFFVSDQSSNSGIQLGGGYSALLGGGSGGLDQKLISLIRTQSVETMVKTALSDVPEKSYKLDSVLVQQEDKSKLIRIMYDTDNEKLGLRLVNTYLKSLQAVYESLELGAGRSVIRVVDNPYSEKISLKKRQFTAIGLFLALGLGIGLFLSMILSVIRTAWDTRSR